MRKSSIIAIAAFAALAAPAFAQSATTLPAPATAAEIQPGNVTDAQTFTNEASVANAFEIQSSQLALTNASSADVKAFAQHMIDDHTKAGEEMQAVLAQQSVTPPATLDQAHADKLAKLQASTGAEFDALYIQMQVEAHMQAVALFSGYAGNGEDGPLKDFAAKTLPTLQQHYDEVTKLRS